jgi:hypothetical protein
MATDILGPDRTHLSYEEEETLVHRVSFNLGVRIKIAREYVRVVLTQIEFEREAPNDIKALLSHAKTDTTKKGGQKPN